MSFTKDVERLLAICEAADDQDTGSLDAFREAATVGLVAALANAYLAPHPLDEEMVTVVVVHLATGMTASVTRGHDTSLNATFNQALDALLDRLEQGGGG